MNFVNSVIFAVPNVAGINRRVAGLALSVVLASSCSSGTATPTSPGTPAAPHTFPQTIMIQEGHAIPEELTIAVGERVSFMNHDRPAYTIAGSGPDCREIDVVGVLPSGETRPTDAFTTAKTCVFRVSRDASALLTDRITIR
jgi:hypothetical protein